MNIVIAAEAFSKVRKIHLKMQEAVRTNRQNFTGAQSTRH